MDAVGGPDVVFHGKAFGGHRRGGDEAVVLMLSNNTSLRHPLR